MANPTVRERWEAVKNKLLKRRDVQASGVVDGDRDSGRKVDSGEKSREGDRREVEEVIGGIRKKIELSGYYKIEAKTVWCSKYKLFTSVTDNRCAICRAPVSSAGLSCLGERPWLSSV